MSNALVAHPLHAFCAAGPADPSRIRKLTRDRAILCGLVIGAALYLVPLLPYGLVLADEGYFLFPALRMLDGDVLYRDHLTHYAPLRYHLLSAIFGFTGPSLLVARGLWVAMIAASAAMAFRVARRFVPASMAWIPGAVYALVPGPWHKAPYGFSTLIVLVSAARALEVPTPLRLTLLGAAAGVALFLRQDVGVAAVGIAIALGAIAAWIPARSTPGRRFKAPLRAATWVAVGVLSATLPVITYYLAQGALADLVDMVFEAAIRQMGVHEFRILWLFGPRSITAEGRGTWLAMLAPIAIYPAAAGALLFRMRRNGVDSGALLLAAILAFAAATLPQLYSIPILVRFLQCALPLYLLTSVVVFDACRGLTSRPSLGADRAAGVTAACIAGTIAAAFVTHVIAGAPKVRPTDHFSGSMRMRHEAEPVRVLDDTLRIDFPLAEEIRLVRAFFAEHGTPGEPILTWPLHPLYHVLLERPNATALLGDHPKSGNFIVSGERKQREVERLLASRTRHVIVGIRWFESLEQPEHIRTTLLRHFQPVRIYGLVVILERVEPGNPSPLVEIQQRLALHQIRPADIESALDMARRSPDNASAFELLGLSLMHLKRLDEAVEAFLEASRLDPQNALHLERAASIRIDQRRFGEANELLGQANRVRPSPSISALRERMQRE